MDREQHRRRTAFAGPIAPIALPEGLHSSEARPFFNRARGRQFEVRAADGVTEIDLYDEIGFWGVTAADFKRQLAGARGDVRLRINSPGGDVFDGITMFNDLAAHAGRVTVEIAGLAASAASVVAMAGDEVVIADNAFIMIHNAWGIELGDKREMAAMAELLGEIDEALARTYAARTGIEVDEIAAMMNDETWMAGAEAVEKGFADRLTGDEASASARFDLSGFRNTPAALRRRFEDAGDRPAATIRDMERALTQDAGLSRTEARALLRAGAPALATQDAGPGPELTAALQRLLATVQGSRT